MLVTVVSPHLDDAVMSVGATMAAMVRCGNEVQIATVFAGDPDRDGPPSYWDARRAVPTAGAAAMLRRDEDLRATKILGVSPRWLPFDDAAYTALRDPDMIWAALEPFLLDADLVLLPGWPLHHSDHRWVTMLVSERLAGRAPTAYYSELPYAAQVIPMVKGALSGRTSDTLHHILGRKLRWVRSATEREDRDAKARAVASYSGEVANLGYRARIAALHDRLLQHESVGFPHSAHVPPGLFKP